MTRRVVLGVLGVALLFVGGVIALGGAALTAFLAGHERITSPTEPVTAAGVAVVTRPSTLSGFGGLRGSMGGATLRITATPARTGRAVFLGVGPAAAVDRYLAGRRVEEVLGLQARPFRLLTAQRVGGGTAGGGGGGAGGAAGAGAVGVATPGTGGFWVARAQGTAATTLTWPITGGADRVVAMNADGGPGVALRVRLSLSFPRLYLAGLAVLATGLVLVVAGAALLALAWRSRRRRADVEPGPRVPA